MGLSIKLIYIDLQGAIQGLTLRAEIFPHYITSMC